MESPPENTQVLTSKSAGNRNRNKLLTTAPLIERVPTLEECRAMCTSPLIPLIERTYFRIIYETMLRPMEALHAKIEQFDKKTGEITATKVKGKRNRYMKETVYKARHVFVSENTLELIKAVISTRKKGYIFEGKNGKPLTKRHMQKQCDKYAKLLSIQKVRAYSEDGRELPLITLMAIRKAGERHNDANEGDRTLSAQAAGHTMKTKNEYYAGEVDWDAVRDNIKKHHPAFTEKW